MLPSSLHACSQFPVVCLCLEIVGGRKLFDIPPLRSGIFLPSSWSWGGLWLPWLEMPEKWCCAGSGPGLYVGFQPLQALGLKALSHHLRSPRILQERCMWRPWDDRRGRRVLWSQASGYPNKIPSRSPKLFGPWSQLNTIEWPQWTPHRAEDLPRWVLLVFLTLRITSYNNHGCRFKPLSWGINQSSIFPKILCESQILGGVISA